MLLRYKLPTFRPRPFCSTTFSESSKFNVTDKVNCKGGFGAVCLSQNFDQIIEWIIFNVLSQLQQQQSLYLKVTGKPQLEMTTVLRQRGAK